MAGGWETYSLLTNQDTTSEHQNNPDSISISTMLTPSSPFMSDVELIGADISLLQIPDTPHPSIYVDSY